ncbi:MAG: potassium-transporting ATPase subunit F [Acidimicrobiales bacterium]
MLASSVDNWVGLALAVAAVLYLVVVLVHPERF